MGWGVQSEKGHWEPWSPGQQDYWARKNLGYCATQIA